MKHKVNYRKTINRDKKSVVAITVDRLLAQGHLEDLAQLLSVVARLAQPHPLLM